MEEAGGRKKDGMCKPVKKQKTSNSKGGEYLGINAALKKRQNRK